MHGSHHSTQIQVELYAMYVFILYVWLVEQLVRLSIQLVSQVSLSVTPFAFSLNADWLSFY